MKIYSISYENRYRDMAASLRKCRENAKYRVFTASAIDVAKQIRLISPVGGYEDRLSRIQINHLLAGAEIRVKAFYMLSRLYYVELRPPLLTELI